MTRGRNFRGRFIGNRGKRIQVGLVRFRPPIPYASNKHVTRWPRVKLQNEIPLLLAGGKLAVFVEMQWNVFIEAANHHDRMITTEYLAPEVIDTVAASVVHAGKPLVVICRLAR